MVKLFEHADIISNKSIYAKIGCRMKSLNGHVSGI